MPREAQGGEPATGGQQASGPGGGLGAPIEAPDPLSGSRWYIISIFVVVLAGGGYWLFRMQNRTSHASTVPASAPPRRIPSKSHDPQQHAASPSRPLNGSNGSGVLEAIKEELFQLESDRLQGKLSQQEYEISKTGLETLLRRQLKKS